MPFSFARFKPYSKCLILYHSAVDMLLASLGVYEVGSWVMCLSPSISHHPKSPGFFTWHPGLHEQLEKAVSRFCLLHIGRSKVHDHVQRQCRKYNSWKTDKEKHEQIRLLLQTICLGTFVDFFCILFMGTQANMNTYFTFPLFSCERLNTIYMPYIYFGFCLCDLITYLGSIHFSVLL